MFQQIYLEPAQVPAVLKGSYTGKKFRAEVTEHVTIPADAGLWSGGSRELYSCIRTIDGANVPFPGQQEAPWGSRADRKVTLQPGLVVVRASHFCGKDIGLTYFLHPADAAPLLPAPTEKLPTLARVVLAYTRCRKSSYNGQDRFEMARADYRHEYSRRGPLVELTEMPIRAAWDAAKADLIGRGLLNKAGAITPAGRNVAEVV